MTRKSYERLLAYVVKELIRETREKKLKWYGYYVHVIPEWFAFTIRAGKTYVLCIPRGDCVDSSFYIDDVCVWTGGGEEIKKLLAIVYRQVCDRERPSSYSKPEVKVLKDAYVDFKTSPR